MKIYTVAIIFFHNKKNNSTVEIFVCVGNDKKQAEAKADVYAKNFAKEINLKSAAMLCVAIEQNPLEIQTMLNFVRTGFLENVRPKREKLNRSKLELKAGGKSYYI